MSELRMQNLVRLPDHLVDRVDSHFANLRRVLVNCKALMDGGIAFYAKDGKERGLRLGIGHLCNSEFARCRMGLPREITDFARLPPEAILAGAGLIATEAYQADLGWNYGIVKAKADDLAWLIPDYIIVAGVFVHAGLPFARTYGRRGSPLATITSRLRRREELMVIGINPVRIFGRGCEVGRKLGKTHFGRERVVDSLGGEGYAGGNFLSIYAPSAS